MRAIILRKPLGAIIEQLLNNQDESGNVDFPSLDLEKKRGKMYFDAGQPDMAGGGPYGSESARLSEITRFPIDELRIKLTRYAVVDDPILLIGESGTGKEAAAWTLHDLNPERRDKPFVAFNCANLQDKLLESHLFGYQKGAFTGADKAEVGLIAKAEGGTLFLDEFPDMTAMSQAKMLRLLENGQYFPLGSTTMKTANIRFIAAGQPGRLKDVRTDLIERMGPSITIPSLAEIITADKESGLFRIAKILLERFIGKPYPKENGQCEQATPADILELKNRIVEHRDKLNEYNWQGGNVRRLRKILRGWMLEGDTFLDNLFDSATPATVNDDDQPTSTKPDTTVQIDNDKLRQLFRQSKETPEEFGQRLKDLRSVNNNDKSILEAIKPVYVQYLKDNLPNKNICEITGLHRNTLANYNAKAAVQRAMNIEPSHENQALSVQCTSQPASVSVLKKTIKR
jgi:DNA-binding NtrC family response regulator